MTEPTDIAVSSAKKDYKEVDIAVLKRFQAAVSAYDKQTKRELDDLRFCDDPDGQWLQEHRDARKPAAGDGIPIAGRPCLTINMVKPAVQQVANEARNARLSIQVNPKGDGASQKNADKIKGLYRNIEVESRANMARMSCFTRALKCGRGYYRILTDYANDGDDQQDIIIEPIENQHCVVLGRHSKPDGSDAMEAWIIDDMSFEDYKREFPNSYCATLGAGELQTLGTDIPSGWVDGGSDDETRTIRVAEHFKVVVTPEKRGERTFQKRTIEWQKINGYEQLETQVLDGRWIPIVQFLADPSNINGERTSQGIIRNSKDSQRMYNAMASEEMQMILEGARGEWVLAEGQQEGFEHIWGNVSGKRYAYRIYRPKTVGGELAPPPHRDIAEPPIQATSLARRQAREDIQAVTQSYDEVLGKGTPGDSGRKVMALQAQGRHGNSNYLSDFAEYSLTHEARIVIDLMPHVYVEEGRVLKILTGDDDSASSVILKQPFMQGPDGAVPAQPGDQRAETFDLDGRYSVVASVGKSFETRHVEADAMLGEIAAAVPQAVPWFADLWVRSKDMPYGDELADRFKAMLPPPIQQMLNKGQSPQDPQQLQQQVLQLQAQLQEAQQLAQEAQAGIAKAQIDAQSREKIKAAELESKQQIEQMKAQLAEMKMQLDASLGQQKIQADMEKTVLVQNQENQRAEQERLHMDQTHRLDLAHSDAQQSREMQHDQQTQSAGFAHEHATRAADVGHEAETHAGDLSHERTMSESDQQHQQRLAKMKPKPTKGST
jgi:hypothetical protein